MPSAKGRKTKDLSSRSDNIYEKPGIWKEVYLIDEASMHPGMFESEDVVKEKLALADYIYEYVHGGIGEDALNSNE